MSGSPSQHHPHDDAALPGPSAHPTVGVLALQGDVREHLAALREQGADAVAVRRPEELSAVDGLVLPGGESTTMSRLLVTFELLEPLRARIAEGMPAYGSCAGMILLAREVLDGRPDQEQLGGLDVVVRRNAFGRQVDSFETDLDVDGVVDRVLRIGPDGAVHPEDPTAAVSGAGDALGPGPPPSAAPRAPGWWDGLLGALFGAGR